MPTLAPLEEVNELMKGIWASGIMTHNGPLVQRFEKETAKFLDTPNLVACVNGTIGLQMAIRALRLKGEIITTPFTFIATINSNLWEEDRGEDNLSYRRHYASPCFWQLLRHRGY